MPDPGTLWQHIETLFHCYIASEDDHFFQAPRPALDELGQEHGERASMLALESALQKHALPLTQIGFGNSGIVMKAVALLHALRLECFSDSDLQQLCGEVVAVVSDGGVEALLTSMSPTPVSQLLPYFRDTADRDINLLLSYMKPSEPSQNQHDHEPDAIPAACELEAQMFEEVGPDEFPPAMEPDLAEAVFEEPPLAPSASFHCAFAVPGPHHVVHNATEGLRKVLETYPDNIFKAQQVCKLLRRRDLQKKLLERCFQDGVGAELGKSISEFKGKIHPGRWGTVAFSIPELLKTEGALRWGWDRARFLGRDDPHHAQENDHELQEDVNEELESTRSLIETAHRAITSAYWWAWLKMFEGLCALLREAKSVQRPKQCLLALRKPCTAKQQDRKHESQMCFCEGLGIRCLCKTHWKTHPEPWDLLETPPSASYSAFYSDEGPYSAVWLAFFLLEVLMLGRVGALGMAIRLGANVFICSAFLILEDTRSKGAGTY